MAEESNEEEEEEEEENWSLVRLSLRRRARCEAGEPVSQGSSEFSVVRGRE